MLIYDGGLREMTPEEIAELEASEAEIIPAGDVQDELKSLREQIDTLEKAIKILLGVDENET